MRCNVIWYRQKCAAACLYSIFGPLLQWYCVHRAKIIVDNDLGEKSLEVLIHSTHVSCCCGLIQAWHCKAQKFALYWISFAADILVIWAHIMLTTMILHSLYRYQLQLDKAQWMVVKDEKRSIVQIRQSHCRKSRKFKVINNYRFPKTHEVVHAIYY